MTRIPTPLPAGLLGAALTLACACGEELPGTQVGFENDTGCQRVSTEAVTDLEAPIDGYVSTPRDILDALPGTFRGPLLGAEEVPMDGEATLTVGASDEALSLERYEPTPTDRTATHTHDMAAHCLSLIHI